jgi:hypothetical protein
MDDESRYYRKSWMTDDQWSCAKFVAELFRGFHHVCGVFKPLGSGIEISVSNGNWAATYDYDGLTRAVIMAHDQMIRFEIAPSGPRMLKLCLFQRHKRDGRMHERHPTIEDAVSALRGARVRETQP